MMKRFKFGLVGIVLGLFGLISFSNADFTNNYYCPSNCNFTFNVSNVGDLLLTNNFGNMDITVYYLNRYGTSFTKDLTLTEFNTLSGQELLGNPRYFSGITKVVFYRCSNGTSCTLNATYSNLGGNCPECEECETCPEINTGDILSGSCDTNYCVENDLCPVPSNFSQLFINDIEHQSAPLINITIPYEYSWDSSVNSGQFDLVISGQNVDYEYIDNIVRTQKSKPSTEDFNNIITGLIPLFIPGLVIILFIWFVFKFIKKIF